MTLCFLSRAGLAMAAVLAASPACAGSFQSLYSFAGGTDGSGPYGKLVMDKSGLLYGVTITGGTSQRGNIFSFDPASSTLTSLYSFTGGSDGSNPQSGLILDAKGNLYGVTPTGGNTALCSGRGCGTVFRYDPVGAKLTTLYQFTDQADGAQPLGAVLLDKGALYGTTTLGGTGADCGAPGCGTIYRFELASKIFTALHELVPEDGDGPEASLLRLPSGLLYGTVSGAGPHGSGTVFSIDPATGAYIVVHGFDYHVDGSTAASDLIFHKGLIYGTMSVGGPTNATDGTVYSLVPATGAVTTLYSFTGGADGAFPEYGVAEGAHGLLYGGTRQGGGSGAGTLFQVNPKTLGFTVIHDFSIGDGEGPSGPLLPAGKSGFYGVTSGGGRGHGTIFQVVP